LNMRWSEVPTKLPGQEYPGLVQWTPVDGASAYDVWFMEPNKIIRTKTNAADEREYYTFHQQSPWPNVVHWRVRAVRKTYGELPNFLPTVTYGPWSPVQTSTNPTFERFARAPPAGRRCALSPCPPFAAIEEQQMNAVEVHNLR